MKQGMFITVEGPEGAGKTTVVQLLVQELQKEGYKVVSTREPGGIKIAEQIRHVILDKENTSMDERTEALLYAAARRQHLVEKVIPSIEEGAVVLCDRFVDSSLAYQGHARGLGMDEVLRINQFAISGFMPALTLYFDIAPEEGLKRIEQSNVREVNRLDLENLSFHRKVREGYLMLVDQYQERIKVINAEMSVEHVFNQALSVIKQHLHQK